MEFDDLCIEETQVVGYLVAALKDFRYIVKLWKGRSNFMENAKQFIVTLKVVARNLSRMSTAGHCWWGIPNLQQEPDWALKYPRVSRNC